MANKDYIPRFFIYNAFIIILISLFFPYIVTESYWTGSENYYGYEGISVWLVLIMSAILIITYRHNSELTKRMLFYPFVEYVILMIGLPLITIPEASLRFGYGYYLGIYGLLYQLIGIITAIALSSFQSKGNTKVSSDAPPTRSEQKG